MKRLTQFIYFFLMLILGVACSATYNWREVRMDEQGFVALFPSKTSIEKNTIQYSDHKLPMTMVAANADDALFAIGAIPIQTGEVSVKDLVVWMKTNTAKLIKDDQPAKEVELILKTAANPAQKITATGFNLAGLGPDGNYRLYWVRWVVCNDAQDKVRVYQLSALKPFKSVPSKSEKDQMIEQFDTFLSGFHPY